ncbi:tRNA uridine 5-carboxymethylaminomethyl modification enzyme MnmG [Gossypium arboreum]|uniref:tRNA uridine 5-carboxymethylaminomethyl modification enzyme MnmG n=1 Tax=Gossypium arboreum TaxID=29729 RepID=A0A0B0PP71_GOSAR|nr:tRNA uridine 5-carboxymethylaminomethyl modification enzyme MnmG [Gossypium arboreum]
MPTFGSNIAKQAKSHGYVYKPKHDHSRVISNSKTHYQNTYQYDHNLNMPHDQTKSSKVPK